VLELHASGETRVVTETRPLEDVNEAMADVEAGRVPGRVVFDLRA
jgi:propanol-preferring alcohol dehydrogenase